VRPAAGRDDSGNPTEDPRLGTIPADQQACVWMRAGVIAYRLCDRSFDCEHCLLDAALHGRDAQATPADWARSGYRLFPRDRQFSAAHAWVHSLSPELVRIGVDALAAWLLGTIVKVTVPEQGSRVERGRPLARFGAQGGEVVIASPVDGSVLARNDLVLDCPELIASVPYGAGWLVEVGLPRQDQQLPGLLCGPDAERLSRGQLLRFYRRMEGLIAARALRVGATAADGGEPLIDPQAMLGSATYLRLVQEILT
jgi:glycine cleavage system H protein